MQDMAWLYLLLDVIHALLGLFGTFSIPVNLNN